MDNITVAAASVANRLGQTQVSLRTMQEWTARASAQGAELIVFPELNLSGHTFARIAAEIAEPVPGPATEQVIALAEREKIAIAFGIIERAGERVYCTHALVNGSGLIGKQRKIHVPVQEQDNWEPGDEIRVFDIGKAKVGMTVCRDSFFGEMTRTLYFKGAEIVVMPFGYYNVPRSRYLSDTIHGKSIVKACWENGFYALACNSAGDRAPSEWEPNGRRFPGWAGIISPWGRVIAEVNSEGSGEAMLVTELTAEELQDRRDHSNFLAAELRPELYQFH